MNTSATDYETIDDIVRKAIRAFTPFIKKTAYMIAAGDAQLMQDMEQEAWIVLWQLDPTRFDPDDRAYLEGAMRNRMIDVVRSEFKATFHDKCISLDMRAG